MPLCNRIHHISNSLSQGTAQTRKSNIRSNPTWPGRSRKPNLLRSLPSPVLNIRRSNGAAGRALNGGRKALEQGERDDIRARDSGGGEAAAHAHARDAALDVVLNLPRGCIGRPTSLLTLHGDLARLVLVLVRRRVPARRVVNTDARGRRAGARRRRLAGGRETVEQRHALVHLDRARGVRVMVRICRRDLLELKRLDLSRDDSAESGYRRCNGPWDEPWSVLPMVTRWYARCKWRGAACCWMDLDFVKRTSDPVSCYD